MDVRIQDDESFEVPKQEEEILTPQADDQFTYDPVPLKVVRTIRVKYHFCGRLVARPYPDNTNERQKTGT